MLDAARLRDLAVNDAGFAFDPTTGHTYNLNATGLAILHALKDGDSVEQVVARLGDSFAPDPDVDLARDVDEFVRQLREQGLVK